MLEKVDLLSDLLILQVIDDQLVQAFALLSYRLGLLVELLEQSEVHYILRVINDCLLRDALIEGDLRNMRLSLRSFNVVLRMAIYVVAAMSTLISSSFKLIKFITLLAPLSDVEALLLFTTSNAPTESPIERHLRSLDRGYLLKQAVSL